MSAKFLTMIIMFLPAAIFAETVDGVRVLNDRAEVVKSLSPSEVEQFREQLSAKKEISVSEPPSWSYKIDVSGEQRGDRWLYDPRGLIRVLSMKKTSVYQVPDPEKMNELLGTPNNSLQGRQP